MSEQMSFQHEPDKEDKNKLDPKKVLKLTVAGLDQMRQFEGFPQGKAEDIIALSDPPYYTACPNPFIQEFIDKYGTPYDETSNGYHREPFSSDVSEGKNDALFNAHSYHTKVPHRAIMRYILHYTEPGDIIFDGFCGTGMTGVAAQLCGQPDPEFKLQIEQEMTGIKWEARRAILGDLSPAATFIAYNYNNPVDAEMFKQEALRILTEVERELGWMYETQHTMDGQLQRQPNGKPVIGRINYTVWSDVFSCPECGAEIVFWDVAVSKDDGTVLDAFPCPSCRVALTKHKLERAWETVFDRALGETIRCTRQMPVLINYTASGKRYEKRPDAWDMDLLRRIEEFDIPWWFPNEKMMFKGEKWGDSWRAGYHAGITNVHHFYTRRNLATVAFFLDRIKNSTSSERRLLVFILTAITQRITKLNQYNIMPPGSETHGDKK